MAETDNLPALVRDWLGKETVERLLQFAQLNEHFFEDSGVYKDGRLSVRETVRASKTLGLGNFESELKAKLIDLLPVMFDRLGIKRFVPSKIETELVAHGHGAFFLPHIDTHRREGHLRVISAVYYFHSLPRAFSGGLFRLYPPNKGGSHVDIPPDYDTIAFFPSFFPHEVLPVKCPSQHFIDSRFSVNFFINRN